MQYVLSTPSSPSGTPNLFGSSVSGRLQTTTNTADLDNIGDFIIGAPGYDITQDTVRLNAGGAQIVEGGLIKLTNPRRPIGHHSDRCGRSEPAFTGGSLPRQRDDPRRFADLRLRLPRAPTVLHAGHRRHQTKVTVNGVAYPQAPTQYVHARPRHRER